jgi:hypothetical protein
MFCDLRHGLRYVPEAACALWIANLARAPTGRDVLTHAVDGRRTASSPDLSSYVCFILTKAIADYASSRRLLLPDGDAKIVRRERVVRAIGVDHLARVDRTKTILSGFEALKGDFREKGLHRQEIDGRTLRLARRARKR